MNPSAHRYADLDTSGKLLSFITPEIVRDSLEATAQWLTTAVEESGHPGKCCRNALYHEDGRVTWLYPNSNTAELISAWIDLAHLHGDDSYTQRAVDYADGFLSDPEKGLYRGADLEAHGLPWYWTDGGTYGGLYAMRMPFHLHRLYEETGEARYLDICDVIGRTLLRRQLDSGMVSAAWDPQIGWMHEMRVGSRYVYAVATFATLWRITGDEAYRRAYDKALSAMLRLQNPDGSFFQMHDPRTAQPLDSSIKMHFTAYILNTLLEAHTVTKDARLVECARRVSDHLAGVFYYQHMVPYCTGKVGEPADQMEADSSIQDSSAGLFWLADLTGEAVYRDVALKLWFESWLHQIPQGGREGWKGAVMRGVNPTVDQTIAGVPTNRKHLHHDPTVIGRSDLWFAVSHVFASRRLLGYLSPRHEEREVADAVLSRHFELFEKTSR